MSSRTFTKDISKLIPDGLRRIDEATEAKRHDFITPGSGQAMVYEQKYNEAAAYLADPAINPSLVPHVYAEIGVTGATAQEVAEAIVEKRNQWMAVSAFLEQRRLAGKKALAEATSKIEYDAALEQATNWPEL